MHPKRVFRQIASEKAGNHIHILHFTALIRIKTLKTRKKTKNEKMTHFYPKRVFSRIAWENTGNDVILHFTAKIRSKRRTKNETTRGFSRIASENAVSLQR